MTANHHIKLFTFFQQNLKIDKTQATDFVDVFDEMIEDKFEEESKNFLSKSEGEKIDFKIELLRQEIKTSFAEMKVEIKSEKNSLILWTVSTGIAVVGLILVLLKL